MLSGDHFQYVSATVSCCCGLRQQVAFLFITDIKKVAETCFMLHQLELNTRRPPCNQTRAVLPRSCMTHLTPQLPELHSRLHRAAISGKAIQRDTQGKHA